MNRSVKLLNKETCACVRARVVFHLQTVNHDNIDCSQAKTRLTERFMRAATSSKPLGPQDDDQTHNYVISPPSSIEIK